MLRRIKREVEKSLLPKIEMHINVGITETQKSIYRQLLKKSTIEKGSSVSHYKNILVQLRKVCDHPYLFPGVEPEGAPELGDHLVKACGKMQFLDRLLKKAREDNSLILSRKERIEEMSMNEKGEVLPEMTKQKSENKMNETGMIKQ